ncbi:hypothetical protein [Parasitella parasitica]|uniref:Palmitoyltransferase n=1 Tax=Parasitella parasitica TaxID=35722 RepID=A0A0B7NT38_9FUNG|nr:hypothetical protein [Parasitella parasitica]
MAIVTPPGDMEAYRRPTASSSSMLDNHEPEPSMRTMLLEMEEHSTFPQSCKKCQLPKPERAHHCSVCNTCILRFDHHCKESIQKEYRMAISLTVRPLDPQLRWTF